MSMSETMPPPRNTIPWFQIFKYSVYGLLCINLALFFQEDYLASTYTFAEGVSFGVLIEAFAATIDTASWIILLFIFELETRIIDDKKLKGSVELLLSALKLLCYVVIAYAVYGYISKYVLVHSFEVSAVTDLCASAGQNLAFMESLDEYAAVTAANCSTVTDVNAFYGIPDTNIIASRASLDEAQSLALIDVVNAGDWLLVVLVLGGEVWLQMKGHLTDGMIKVSLAIKAVLYFVLLACAVLWGIDGDFLDFWDAFLWIVAFVFIEMNLFEWHAEVEERGDKVLAT